MPRVILTSPDDKSMLRLEPALNEPWWHLSHRDGCTGAQWQASFDGATPVELIAAVTDALTHPDYNARAMADPYRVLTRAGWDVASNSGFRSPDSRVRGERHNYSGSTDWRVTASLYTNDPVWKARFSGAMPRVLVAAFLAARRPRAGAPFLRTDPGPLPPPGRPAVAGTAGGERGPGAAGANRATRRPPREPASARATDAPIAAPPHPLTLPARTVQGPSA
ncbi:DUF317 domain-containing protein [Streptomyces sp. NPDC056374]|uniref:DUF317 domain-containing protein n=1 Tax=unclassified Streptomyces TaxID=2593676 RepID=UPI0035DF6139